MSDRLVGTLTVLLVLWPARTPHPLACRLLASRITATFEGSVWQDLLK